MSDNMETSKVGVLSLIEISEDEMNELLEFLQKRDKTEIYDILYGVFEHQFLKFIDLFSGETIKVPTRDSLFKSVIYIKIYSFCKKRHFTEEAIESAAHIFDKRKSSIRRIIDKVKRVKGET